MLLDLDIHHVALNSNDSSKILEEGAVINIVKKNSICQAHTIFLGNLNFKITLFLLSKDHNKFR